MLNQSKGYSAQGLRALIDRDLYKTHMQKALKKIPNLHIYEGRYQE
jgi:tRNA U34 5-carboxymethylaminomethyl modifying enzyme MnmG/GidA